MTKRFLFAFAISLTTAGAAAAHASSGGTPPLPSGWWVNVIAEGSDVGAPGGAWRFGKEIVTVDPAHENRIHRVVVDQCEPLRITTEASSWQCTVGNGHFRILIEHKAATVDGKKVEKVAIELSRAGEKPFGRVKARPATQEENAKFDALVAKGK